MMRIRNVGSLVGLAAIVLLGLAPLLGIPSYYLRIFGFVAINIIVVCGLVVLYGYCDQISLATGAFYGVGAYVVAIMTSRFDVPLIVALLIAGLIAAVLGSLVGLPALRLKSHYLAMATLAFSELVIWVFAETPSITGGVDGFALTKSYGLGSLVSSDTVIHLVIVSLLYIVLWVTFNLTNFIPGIACSAVGQHEVGARASGVAVEAIKVRAYVFSAIVAALGGGLYAALVGFISPHIFGPSLSIMFLAMAIIGGRESVAGPVISALAITLIQYSNVLIPGLSPSAREFVSSAQIDLYALAIICFTLFAPAGIRGFLGQKREGVK